MTTKHLPKLNMQRRDLLKGSVALAVTTLAAGALPLHSVFAANTSAVDAFTQLSSFLVSESVNPVLSQRYYVELDKRNPNFADQVAALNKVVADQGYKHVDDYLAAPNPDADLKKIAGKIISAWYLGIVGEAADSVLISYADAMMYQPTHATLIIPTYAAGPDTWGPKPADTH